MNSDEDTGSSMVEYVSATKPYTYACFENLSAGKCTDKLYHA